MSRPPEAVALTIKYGAARAEVEGVRVVFSPHQCFRMDGSAEDLRCLGLLANYLRTQPGLAFYGGGPFFKYISDNCPELLKSARGIIVDVGDRSPASGLSSFRIDALPASIQTVFLCETRAFQLQQMAKMLPQNLRIIDARILGEIAQDEVPIRAWLPIVKSIYPLEIPDVRFKDGLDFLLLDCPARNLALMPNGLAYVHNALKKTKVNFQTFDLDIVCYHRFHTARLFDEGGRVMLDDGRELPVDPWQSEHYDLWADKSVIEYFRPVIHEVAEELIRAKPKVLGLSIQQCNLAFSRELVCLVKARLPELIVVVGGFSCYRADIGRRAFEECDYMCIGESDLTVGPLVEALADGKRPFNLPGILSRFDTKDYKFIPAPMPHELEKLDFPKYDWFDLRLYRNFDGYQLTPILASRGCRWSRCTFCAERFYWRIRPAAEFVDEVQWLSDNGCHLFMFNESDLNGNPEKLLDICDEIIRRGIKVRLTGQLRIHKKSDRAFFDKLHAAGFVSLRFGVDAFSENTLRLQMKGYTKDMVRENLKNCWEAGIYTEVNWVIGVPGETDEDVEEGIQFILENQPYIGRLTNINPLILVNGSVYWIDPESHKIVFREPKDELYAGNPHAIPADKWYSEDPFIDANIRRKRFEYIVRRLHGAGFPLHTWAKRVIDDVATGRDRARSGVKSEAAA